MDEGAHHTRAGAAHVQNSHGHFTPRAAEGARRTVLVASAWKILDAEDNPSADAAIYGYELERDLPSLVAASLPACAASPSRVSRVGCECE